MAGAPESVWGVPVITDNTWPRAALVDPLPPPSGGVDLQCKQLPRRLEAEGVRLELPLRGLGDADLAPALPWAGLTEVRRLAWPGVRRQWPRAGQRGHRVRTASCPSPELAR